VQKQIDKVEYKYVLGYEGYYKVSNTANILSLHSGIILIPRISKNGRYCCILYINGVSKQFLYSRIVYEAFNGKIPEGLIIDHEDGDFTNNNLSNLRPCTHRQNASFDNVIREKSSSFVGVCFNKRTRKFQAEIRINKERVYLGRFESEYEAHLHYQDALNSHLLTGGK